MIVWENILDIQSEVYCLGKYALKTLELSGFDAQMLRTLEMKRWMILWSSKDIYNMNRNWIPFLHE